MNYKQQNISNATKEGYSKKALESLAKGTYKQTREGSLASYKQNQGRQKSPVVNSATMYNNRLQTEAKKYQYNEAARKNNTLEKRKSALSLKSSDHDYLQRIYDRFGDSDLTLRTLRESNRTKDWEKKYGKSYDQIYKDFLADQGNVKMEMGEKHPFLTELGTIANSVPTALQTVPALVTNLVDPTNPTAQKYEKMREKKSEENKYWRAGVKEHTGEKGDKVIDTLNSVADRMANVQAGNAVAPGLGAVMAGLSEANKKWDEVNLRDGLSGRKKAATVLTHGAIEGIGTAITGGILDKIPAVDGVWGSLLNVGKGAGNAAIENSVSEAAEMTADTLMNRENSEKELNKALYMQQGMSEKDANKKVKAEQAERVKQAAITGALFGGGMRGLTELKKVPALIANAKANKADVDPVIADATEQAQGAVDEINALREQIPETPKANPEVANNLQSNLDEVNERINNLESTRANVLQSGMDETQANAIIDKIDNALEDLNNRKNEILVGMDKVKAEPQIDPAKAQAEADYLRMQDAENVIEDLPTKPIGNVEETPDNILPKDMAETPESVVPGRRMKVLEGEELDNAKAELETSTARLEELDRLIDEKQKEIDELPALKKNAKTKAQYVRELKDMKSERAALEKRSGVLTKQINGELVPVKEMLDEKAYKSFYDNRANGINNDIAIARKFAGDTPEARKAADAARKALYKYIESGSLDDFGDFMQKIDALDQMAREVNATYVTKNGSYTYADKFGEDGNLSDAVAVWRDTLLRDIPELANSRYITDEPEVKPAEAEVEEPVVEEPVAEPIAEEPIVEPTPKAEVPQEVPTVKPVEPTPQAEPKAEVPYVTPPEEPTSLSKRYYSLKNSDLFQTAEAKAKLEKAKEAGSFDKGVEGRLQAMDEALQEYVADPEAARAKNMNRQWDGGKDIDTSMLLMKNALDTDDQTEFNLVALKQAQELKGAGRKLRATRDYSGTKEGTLAKAVEFLNDKADGILSSKKTRLQLEDIAGRAVDGDFSALQKLGMDETAIKNIQDAVEAGASKDTITKLLGIYKAVGKTGVSSEAIQKVNAIYDEIEARGLNPTSKARADLEVDAFKVLAQDMGGKRTPKEIWDAWRYLAMLGNPKTHLRNVLGNTTHYMVTEAKDNVGAALEAAIDKTNRKFGGEGIDRTKAILTADDNNLVAKAAQDADDVAYASLNDMGNKYNVKDEIGRARDAFNNKALSKVEELNSYLLDKEDYSALKRKYSRSMARFLKANGADESIFDATDDASKALLDKARVYAIDQAKQATFHEYSKVAEALTQFSQKLQEGNLASKTGGMIVEGLVPFKKTPINILKQAIKYSPVSLAKAIGKTVDAIKTGNSSASDAIEDLASGLTGTGIMALGYFLAHQGLLTGKANEDYDVDNAESEQGMQNYAIQIGDKSYTLDWLAPFSLPLFVGAELDNMFSQEGDDEADIFDKVITSLSTIAEPVTEMSMLQGIQNVLNELSYSKENVLATFATNATLGYASQGIPTLAGQVARAIDPYRRSTYSDQPGGFKRQFDKALTKSLNKLPFVSLTKEPYIDYKGNKQETQGLASATFGNNFGTRLIDQMLSPGYYKEGNITPVDEELNRLYEATGVDVYPNVASGTIDGKKVDKQTFTKYQEQYGKTTDELYNAAINSSTYNTLDDTQKQELLTDLRQQSMYFANHDIGGKELDGSVQKLYDLYKEQGADGLIRYYDDKYHAANLDMSVSNYQKWQKEYPGGAAQYAEDKKAADELGLTVDQYNKKNAEYEGGAEGYAEDKQTALETGFTKKDGTPDVNAYNEAVSIFGNDLPKLEAYRSFENSGYKEDKQKVPELMRMDMFTPEEKGKILRGTNPDDLGKSARALYDMGGYEAVYYYYVAKLLADADENGYVKKAEKNDFLNNYGAYADYGLTEAYLPYFQNYLK